MKTRIERIGRGLYFAAYGLLILLALLIPLFDRQPVNAIALLFAITVLSLAALQGGTGFRQWDAIDWTMLALLVSALLSTLYGLPGAGRYQGVSEAVSHLTLFLFLRHGGHSEAARLCFAVAVIAGTTSAAMLALVSHVPGTPFQLPGVAGSIRSALYTGITLMLCLGLALHAQGMRRYLSLGLVLFLAIVVLSMASRAVTIGLGLALLLGFISSYRWKAGKYLISSLFVMFIAFSLMPKHSYNRFQAKASELIGLVSAGKISLSDQSRTEIWRASWAWVQRGEHVLLGIGPRNYHLIDKDRLGLDPPLQLEEARHAAHAHNLFLTRYIEQGLLGVTALLALLVLVARRLLQDALQRQIGWSWWAAWGSWSLPVLNGLVGSPWNHDYAGLAVMIFGLYLAGKTTSRP